MSSEKRDYYEVLGVAKDANKDQIKSSYRKLALQYHPDRNKAPGAEERFKEISEAYAVLSDDAKRAQYDRFGHEGIQGRYSNEDIFRTANFDEILRDLGFGGFGGFGGSIFDMFFGNMTGSGRGSRRGADLRYDLDLTLEQVASGLNTEIDIPRTERCSVCKGTGSRPGSTPRVCTECGGRGQVQRISSLRNLSALRPAEPARARERCSIIHVRTVRVTAPCNGTGKLRSRYLLELTVNLHLDCAARATRVKAELQREIYMSCAMCYRTKCSNARRMIFIV